jgi:hypothetical protein
MKITKKLATKLHEGTRRKNKKICVICGFLLIITSGLSSPVYTKSRKQENKGKSSSFGVRSSTQSKKAPQYRSKSAPSQRPSRSTSPPGVENKKRSGGWGNNSPNQRKPGKLGVNTGKLIRHPRKPPPEPPEPIPEPPPEKPGKSRPPGKRRPANGYWCPGGFVGQTTYYANEEYLESPDSKYPPTSRESNGYPAGGTRKYQINDSFVPNGALKERIDEYNAANPHSPGLEYPLTSRSESLTYQILDSLGLIESMEKKIQYYQQQLDLVRNSNLSPVERSKRELFWLERIDRLQESKQKEQERVFELRSQIEEENRKS